MSTIIRLDKKALQFLLDELGDDFKLELGRAVTTEFIKGVAAKDIPAEVVSWVRVAKEKAMVDVKEQIDAILYDKYRLDASTKASIKLEVHKIAKELVMNAVAELHEEINKIIREELDKAEEHYKTEIPEVIEIRVKHRLNRLIDERLKYDEK